MWQWLKPRRRSFLHCEWLEELRFVLDSMEDREKNELHSSHEWKCENHVENVSFAP